MVNPITNTSYILLPTEHPSEGKKKRGVTADPNKFWPNAMIPYAFHSSITGWFQVLIILYVRDKENCFYATVDAWERHTIFLKKQNISTDF